MKKKVYLFDCDGCIMPNLFQNYPLKEQTEKEREIIINSVINRGLNTKLYPNFLRYYLKNCIYNSEIFFITGRQKKEFGHLTQTQLLQLQLRIFKDFKIIYYPNERAHKKELYFGWKIETIVSLIKDNNCEYIIIDDLDEHFKELKKLLKNYSVKYIKVDSNKGWDDLI